MYIIGAVIGGRGSTYTTFEEYDALDGELVCRYNAERTFLYGSYCEFPEKAYFFDNGKIWMNTPMAKPAWRFSHAVQI